MQIIPHIKIRHGKKASLLLWSLVATCLSAQTTTETQPADDTVIELSPFAVTTEKDVGYKASNSIGGTRSNTPIKDIALNIQVFTKDLQNDLLTADQTQLSRYNAALINGGSSDTNREISTGYNSFLFRGFIQNWGLRDGVREYDTVDSQGISRVEVVKGPAAALYGLSYAGGVINTITKTADMTKNFTDLRIIATDQGGERATVDVNLHGKVGTSDVKAAVRYNGAGALTEDKREHSKGKTRFNQVNLSILPLKETEIQLLVSNGWVQKPNDIGYYSVAPTDAAKYGTTVVGIGAQKPLQIVHPEIPWTWNWADTTNVVSTGTNMYKVTINQAVGEDLHFTAYFQNNSRLNVAGFGWDDNGNSQNGSGWDVGGKIIESGWIVNQAGQQVIRKVYHYRDWKDDDHAQGVTGVYKLETGPIKNTFTGGWAHWDERFTSHKYHTKDAVGYKYWELPLQAGIDTASPGAPDDYYLVSPGGNREHNQNSYYFGSWQMSAIDNRLKVNLAINHTQITNLIWDDVDTSQYYSNKVDISKNSPMIGGMFDITKEVSLFFVHSTSLFPTTDKNDFWKQMPSEIGKSNEVGVKVELLNGKISGTLSYYKIKKSGGGVRDAHADNSNKILWDQWRANDAVQYGDQWHTIDIKGWSHTRDDITTADGKTGALGDLVPAELESKGFEADLVIQPMKTLQFVVSYAHNNEESTAGGTKGQTNGGHVKDQLAGLVKYTFDDGAAKGLYIGSGYQYTGKAVADYQTLNGASVARYYPKTFYLEAFVGYGFKAFGVNHSVQFNVKNLTKQADFYGWQNASSSTEIAKDPYKVPTYALYSLSYGVSF